MKFGGRLAAAIEVLDDIGRRHRPAGEALRDWGLSHRFAGAGDRAAIGNIVYNALRRRRSAAWLMGADTPRALAFGALLAVDGAEPQMLAARLADDRFAPPPLDQEELDGLAARLPCEAPDLVRAEAPDWCVPLLERAFGTDWMVEAAALALPPPLDLRVNALKSSPARVLGELEEAGAAPAPLAPLALRIPPIAGEGRHPNVQAEPAYRRGWFEIQDEGSQIAAMLAGARPGMQVLDYCAGAGGKTLALAAAMNNRGQIFAHDADKLRLAPLYERVRRAGVRNVQASARPADLEPLAGRMDIVFVDAPCTGSGTWRRHPDAKWRLSQRQLDMRMAEQSAILESAATYLKPGGLLAYVTCSVFAEENADRIATFLAKTGTGFAPIGHRALWQGLFSDHAPKVRIDERLGISLSPAATATDGFFFAGLRRQD